MVKVTQLSNERMSSIRINAIELPLIAIGHYDYGVPAHFAIYGSQTFH